MATFFINRPIVAMVIAILSALAGGIALLGLPTAQFPEISPPEVQIKASYIGADADTVAQSVSAPIEQQMSGVDNMNYMTSVNAGNGAMTLTVDFDMKTDPNTDQILSQMRVSQANSQLPSSVIASGVTVNKSTASPLLLISLYSPQGRFDNVFLANYAIINLNDALTRIPGVSNVQVFGAGQYAMRCWVDPDRLANLGLTVTDVINAVKVQNNVNPAGQIGGEPIAAGQQFTYTIRAPGRLPSAQDFGNIIVRAQSDGSSVKLRDVARVELGAQNYSVQGRFDGQAAALLAVYQLPGSNAVDAAQRVREFLAQARGRFPQGLEYRVAMDTTTAVTEGLKETRKTLLEALALVTFVVFLFLQNWRAALIPLLAVPVSLLGTFLVFPLLGFSINTLSLFGLVLAIGLVVDDAIVVVEAVGRTAHRARPELQGCDHQGDAGGFGARHRDRVDSRRGVPAHGLHSRHHRKTVPAVCCDHCRGGGIFGVQCADAEPRALRAAAAPERTQHRAPRPVLRAIQSRLRKTDEFLREYLRLFDPQVGGGSAAVDRICGRRGAAGRPGPLGLPAGGGSGLSLRSAAAAEFLLLAKDLRSGA